MTPFVSLFIIVAIYVLSAYPLQRIAQSTSDQRDDAFYAWIPVLSSILLVRLAGLSGWWTLVILAIIVPGIGTLVALGFQVAMYVKIGTRFHRTGLGWLAGLLPIIGAWVLAFNVQQEAV